MSKNVRNLSARKGLDDNLFEQLPDQGGAEGERYSQVASKFLVGNANTYGTASFYDFLNPANSGKKGFYCAGSACLLAGTQEAVKHDLEAQFGVEAVGPVYCLGRCYENRAFHVDGKNFSGAEADAISGICIQENGQQPKPYRIQHQGRGILTGHALRHEDCLRLLPTWLQQSPETLLESLRISGLRGRGGAGFPMAIKLDTVRKEQSDQKYIVCNADEGDPGAFSDRYILEEQPHLLMAGMALAGYMAGAIEGVVYIRAEYPESISIARAVADQFNRLFPLPAHDGKPFAFHLKVIKAQGAYICGEETALLNSIEGNRPEVRTRPPFPAQYGLYGKPTAVNNVETLANLPFITQEGGEAYRSVGTQKSTGTKLLSLDSHFINPGLYEVDMGTPLSAAVYELGGGFREPVKALHIGGPLGGLVPLWRINDLTLDFESFASNGFLLGHASILSVPERFPLIKYLEHLFEFTAHESCGKCFPCRIGSVRGKELLRKAYESDYRIDRELLDDLLDTLEKGSLCALGGGIPLPVKNALKYFEAELQPYFKP